MGRSLLAWASLGCLPRWRLGSQSRHSKGTKCMTSSLTLRSHKASLPLRSVGEGRHKVLPQLNRPSGSWTPPQDGKSVKVTLWEEHGKWKVLLCSSLEKRVCGRALSGDPLVNFHSVVSPACNAEKLRWSACGFHLCLPPQHPPSCLVFRRV